MRFALVKCIFYYLSVNFYIIYMYSKCPKCEKSGFEMSNEDIKNSYYRVSLIRCSSCKTVVGCVEPTAVGLLVRELARKLNKPLD